MPQTIKKSILGLNLAYSVAESMYAPLGGGALGDASSNKSLGFLHMTLSKAVIDQFFKQKGFSSYQYEITNKALALNEKMPPIVSVSKELEDGKTLHIGTMTLIFPEDPADTEDPIESDVQAHCSNNILAAIIGAYGNADVLTKIENDTLFLNFADSLERLNAVLEKIAPVAVPSPDPSNSSSLSAPVPPPAKKLLGWNEFSKRIVDTPDGRLISEKEVIDIINQILPSLQNIPDLWDRRQNVSEFAIGLDSWSLESIAKYRGMTDLELTNRSQIADKITKILEKYHQQEQPTPADINELRGAIDQLEGAGYAAGRKRYAGIMAVSGGFFVTAFVLYILGFSVLAALATSPVFVLPVVFGMVLGGAALIYSGLAYRGNKPSFMPAVLYHLADKMEALMSPDVGPRRGPPVQEVRRKEDDVSSAPVYTAVSTPTPTVSGGPQPQQPQGPTIKT